MKLLKDVVMLLQKRKNIFKATMLREIYYSRIIVIFFFLQRV